MNKSHRNPVTAHRQVIATSAKLAPAHQVKKRIKKPFWLPINTESYIADTADLSTTEHGAFLLIRLHYWRSGPPNDDDKILARISRLSLNEWRQVRPTLERFFDISCQWINEEWDVELETAYDHINKASAAGKKAAAERWKKEKSRRVSDYESDTNHMRSASESDADGYANYKVGGMPPTTPCPASPDNMFTAGDADESGACFEYDYSEE